MKEFHGIMASPGIAVGEAYIFKQIELSIPKYSIKTEDVKKEMDRFDSAVEKATVEVENLKSAVNDNAHGRELELLDSHILMMNDPELKKQINVSLNDQKRNVEWILIQVIEDMIAQLKLSRDEYLNERSMDIRDMSNRILNQLLYQEQASLTGLEKPCIVVTHNLMPSDAIGMDKDKVLGIATDAGGKTSHTAILARSLEIPAVLGLMDISRYVKDGDKIILDGNSGKVIVNPDKKTRSVYLNTKEKWEKHEKDLLQLNRLAAETKDGKLINLEANIEIPEEVNSVIFHGADGIGLFRSEFLYIQPNKFPDEEEQCRAYKSVLESLKGKSVTIRTLDLGGDKQVPGLNMTEEKNPILGWRAIRYCLSQPDIFKIQLRALLRASVHGNLKIMFPMISGVEEVEHSLEIYETAKKELKAEGIEFNENIPIGIMIEIPSAAVTTDILAKKVDFFSIGTNDLIQYTIAVDRGNERIAYLYEPFHPGVLRLIQLTIENGHKQGIPVGMCGEMASNPLATVILLGMGLDEFSMSSISIPEIKRIIRSTAILDAEEVVGNIMEMKSYSEITKYLKNWMREYFDFETY
ncbi:MAG: phosphoenolpyruvate--protein phosphotransferase [Spirochaetes bacterium]|nr:MAG: phosphoenolpyruvate--protein phosphotransferase [Spirochaetota bacterium]